MMAAETGSLSYAAGLVSVYLTSAIPAYSPPTFVLNVGWRRIVRFLAGLVAKKLLSSKTAQ